MAEFDYISWLRSRTPPDPRVPVGPGDDAAVLAPSGRPLLVTTDLLMDGTDFILTEVGPRAAGRKAMAVNLSDIAAMAGVPTAAVVAIALPRAGGRSVGEELYVGIREVADEFGVAIVGGDTNSWEGALVVSVTLLGEATARGPALRSGAKPGDWVMLTGPVGGSLRGRHLTFTPRVREALRLHNIADLHAMIDLSDGLAADLNHILEESRCGAVLDAAAIPIHPDAIELTRTSGKSALAHALGDGEDFELLFAVSPAAGGQLVREQPVPGVTLVKIGECVGAGLWLEENGTRRPLAPTGWVHDLSGGRAG
ncbi:MAG TPA: thiamine-phosphate kinase [Urbifossiella sp.]|jgi:thiamine-monophosphate kinase|nr:thiamine-phosphate kinase [Urbifossiella sp.]